MFLYCFQDCVIQCAYVAIIIHTYDKESCHAIKYIASYKIIVLYFNINFNNRVEECAISNTLTHLANSCISTVTITSLCITMHDFFINRLLFSSCISFD